MLELEKVVTATRYADPIARHLCPGHGPEPDPIADTGFEDHAAIAGLLDANIYAKANEIAQFRRADGGCSSTGWVAHTITLAKTFHFHH